MAYWSSLSVRAAIAVMQAKGSERVAKKAANAVLDARKKKHPTSSLHELATEVSVAVLKAGGDHEVAAAVTVAIQLEPKRRQLEHLQQKLQQLQQQRGQQQLNSEEDASLKATPPKDIKSDSREVNKKNAPSFQSETSSDVASVTPSVTPSMTAKRGQLKEKENIIVQKTKALEKAEQLSLQKEKEICVRLAALDKLESANIDRIVQDRVSLYEFNRGNLNSGSQNNREFGEATRGSEKIQNKESNSNKYPQQPQRQIKSKDEPMKSSVNVQKFHRQSSGTVAQKCNQQPNRTKQNTGFSLFSTKSFRVGKETANRSIGLEIRSSISSKSKKSVGICEKSEKKGRLRSILRKKPSKLIEI